MFVYAYSLTIIKFIQAYQTKMLEEVKSEEVDERDYLICQTYSL